MKLRTKRLIILWVAVVFIVLFIGLRFEKDATDNPAGSIRTETAFIYGYPIAHTFIGVFPRAPENNRNFEYRRHLLCLPKYKYQFIIAILLIGVALVVSFKEKP